MAKDTHSASRHNGMWKIGRPHCTHLNPKIPNPGLSHAVDTDKGLNYLHGRQQIEAIRFNSPIDGNNISIKIGRAYLRKQLQQAKGEEHHIGQ
jgi:hypothetical protein